ncbi:MAG: PIG-L family deacetylase [Dehalococcoidia bacterium]|nr:PIG-L family deacetylase [Dehalococcoidia bacterium]
MTRGQRKPKQPKYQRAMVVVAHADDAEFGCSGTVAKWCKEGMDVVYVIVTDGSKGIDDRTITPQQLASMRSDEQIAAGKILGLKDVRFLGFPDAYLEPTLEVRKAITREIRRFKPDVLITTSPTRTLTGRGYIGHPDHFAAGEAALSAVYPAARDHLTFPELLAEGFEPHKVKEVLIMVSDKPDFWVDVTKTITIAIQALAAHVSQVGDWDAEKMLRRWKRAEGKKRGVQYAEAFKRFVLD